jgi:CHAT domain-containing protein/tetratricopeptide (TPR) repeat protein
MAQSFLFAVAAFSLAAGPRFGSSAAGAPPDSSRHLGVVVESVDVGSPPGKAGIRSGDVLLSWERAANPPSNPAPARGDLATPMDLEEVCIEESDRGNLTILGLRNSQRLAFQIPAGIWDVFDLLPFRSVRLTVRPRLEGRALGDYLAGLRQVDDNHVEQGAALWRPLAIQWLRPKPSANAVWLWFRLGTSLADAHSYESAQEAFQVALSNARRLEMHSAVKQILCAKGKAYSHLREPIRAAESWDEILQICARERRPTLWVATALAQRGTLEWESGRPTIGLEFYSKAVDACAQVSPGNILYSRLVNNRGNCRVDQGDLEGAERDYRLALTILAGRGLKDESWPQMVNLGNVMAERGDLAGAEALHREALEIALRNNPGTLQEAFASGNLGIVTFRQGDFAVAEKYALRDLEITEKLEPRTEGHAECLRDLGDLAAAREDFGAAESYFQRALDIQEELDNPLTVADTLDGLGRVALKNGNSWAATAYFARALSLLESSAAVSLRTATTLSGLGRANALGEDFTGARQFHEKALVLMEKLSPNSVSCAETLHDLGVLCRRIGHLNESAQYLRRSIDVLESQKRTLGGTEEVRTLFGASHADYYRDYIEVLIELGGKEDAFRTLERSRARGLLTLLAERDLVFSTDVPPDLERESKLTDASYDKAQADLKELGTGDKEKQQQVVAQLNELRQKQEHIAERLKAASPRYGSLHYPQPLDLSGTRAALDPGTLLLSYSVGKEKTYLFAVRADSRRGPPLSVFLLPVGEKALRESVKAFRKLIEWGDPSPDLTARARTLYDTLLKPAETLIAGSDRLLILPDGPLHTLPWAALAHSQKSGRPEYLVESKPIHTAISATLYAELKKERRPPGSPAVDVAAFGDPKYPTLPEKKLAVKRGEHETPDEGIGAEDEAPVDPEVRSALRGGFRFEPLPETRKEVEGIVRLYAPRSVAYLGENATEEKARSIGKGVPLIHFACHAVINERFPLDSALVFTIPEHPKEGQDNGLLQAWEIFEKVRIDADLVTLSACESGLGKEMGGEGLIGLTRAFQYAGARSVLSSLWKVEDRATGELMKRFYGYLKAGKPKDEALRLAQIDLIHSPELSQPISWAAFQLNGDWK